MSKKILIVGAGMYGSVCARELTDAGHRCHVIDKREHIGGNCYTKHNDEADCHQHVYGPHIFHTNNDTVWKYINQFTEFNHFVLRPKIHYKNKLYSFPINLFTLYQIYGVTTPEAAKEKLDKVKIPCKNPNNLEDWCLSQVGPELYETFIKGYTQKQWQRSPKELPADIIKRLPIRLTFDDNYFNDRYQGIPVNGYTAIFKKLLDGIPVELSADFMATRDECLKKYDHVIYTGPIDAFFDYSEGLLEYRSLKFESKLIDVPDFQGNAMNNYTEESVPYTRIVEHKHFDMRFTRNKTLITHEFSHEWKKGMTEYYPINTDKNTQTFKQYQKLKKETKLPITFGGRLAEYRYYDMHQIIAAALKQVEKLTKSFQ